MSVLHCGLDTFGFVRYGLEQGGSVLAGLSERLRGWQLTMIMTFGRGGKRELV